MPGAKKPALARRGFVGEGVIQFGARASSDSRGDSPSHPGSGSDDPGLGESLVRRDERSSCKPPRDGITRVRFAEYCSGNTRPTNSGCHQYRLGSSPKPLLFQPLYALLCCKSRGRYLLIVQASCQIYESSNNKSQHAIPQGVMTEPGINRFVSHCMKLLQETC
jgi:hypothetical protein